MTDLSPAAQAVLDAYQSAHPIMHPADQRAVAAALRAAADQVVPLCNAPKIAIDAWRPTVQWHVWDVQRRARADLLAIANELEAMTDFRSQPAADGEVARLVAALREWQTVPLLEERRRAAELLERLYPQPIPVSERLPEAGDCDAEGRCWWWHPSHPESGYQEGWMLRPGDWGTGRYDSDDCLAHTHWLPAHALPLPGGEVE
jgi:hypothetical protein